MTEREKTIRECIAHLQGRPGRNAIRSLKGMLVTEIEQQKQTKPARYQKITNHATEITKDAMNASNSAGFESMYGPSPGHQETRTK